MFTLHQKKVRNISTLHTYEHTTNSHLSCDLLLTSRHLALYLGAIQGTSLKSSILIFMHNNHNQNKKGTGTKSKSCTFHQLLAFAVLHSLTQVMEGDSLPQPRLGSMDSCLLNKKSSSPVPVRLHHLF